ncbi:hypothetical protein ABZW18_09450 [Streptomyces sp. NPDC004647]|uniref:hypothetical protein n=1 Tax=Streptomyces sp. NPDC004647 TaxID=3154671 RepID=UPI00339E2731
MSEGESEPYWDEQAQRWVMGADSVPPYGPGPRPAGPLASWRTRGPWASQPARARGVVLVVTGAVLCAGLGFGIRALVGDGDGGGGSDDARPGPSVSAPLTDGEETSGGFPESEPSTTPATATAVAVPAGFRREQDPAGFTLDVPSGWERSEDKTGVFYKSADRKGLIQVFPLDGPESTPYEALEEAESYLTDNPGYKRLRLERLEPGEGTAESTGTGTGTGGIEGDGADAELEYSYKSEQAGGTRRVLDRVFTGPDGVMYAVLVAGPDEDWPEQRDIQRNVLAAFCPTGYCPATPAPQ